MSYILDKKGQIYLGNISVDQSSRQLGIGAYTELGTKLVKKNISYVTSQEKRIRVIKEKPYFEE